MVTATLYSEVASNVSEMVDFSCYFSMNKYFKTG